MKWGGVFSVRKMQEQDLKGGLRKRVMATKRSTKQTGT